MEHSYQDFIGCLKCPWGAQNPVAEARRGHLHSARYHGRDLSSLGLDWDSRAGRGQEKSCRKVALQLGNLPRG